VRNSKQGAASCSNKLTIRAKVADAALLSGLQAFLREPHTIDALTSLLSARLNAGITARPRLQALSVAERDVLRRKLAHLINAIEHGAATPALLNTMRTREKELAQLDAELDALEEPLAGRLAVIPSWVRNQVRDVAGILSARPERAKAEFQRLGIAFTVSPVLNEAPKPFLRAVGTSDFSRLLAGSGTDFTTTVASGLRPKQ